MALDGPSDVENEALSDPKGEVVAVIADRSDVAASKIASDGHSDVKNEAFPDPKVEEGAVTADSSDASARKVLNIFRQFDSNGDGFIDRHELQRVLAELDPSTWTDRRLGRLLNALDRNRDGKIHYKEFIQWVCSPDSCRDLEAFRNALQVTPEEGKCAPPQLPLQRLPRNALQITPSKSPRSSVATPTHAAPITCRVSIGGKQKQPESCRTPSKSIVKVESEEGSAFPSTSDSTVANETLESSSSASERLIIFDYDGTISVDKDERFKGYRGDRLLRLQAMVKKVRVSQVRCILVTAQFPATTLETTIPALQKTGVCGLFDNEALESRLRLYWDDEEHGTIYNGAKVMLGKIDLIKEVINGKNCWKQTFDPANVLFIDDDPRNFRGNESLGIRTRLLAQDGMVDEDMDLIETFAESGSLPISCGSTEPAASRHTEDRARSVSWCHRQYPH